MGGNERGTCFGRRAADLLQKPVGLFLLGNVSHLKEDKWVESESLERVKTVGFFQDNFFVGAVCCLTDPSPKVHAKYSVQQICQNLKQKDGNNKGIV